MIYDFLSRLDPKIRSYIYDINEQDGIEFSYQVTTEDLDDIQCYKVSYIQFEDGSDSYSICSLTDSKQIWSEGIEVFLEYLEVLKLMDWSNYD